MAVFQTEEILSEIFSAAGIKRNYRGHFMENPIHLIYSQLQQLTCNNLHAELYLLPLMANASV